MRPAADAHPDKPRRALHRLAVPLAAVAWLGCAGGDLIVPSNEPAHIEVVDGDEQIGGAGLPLEQPVVVRLVDEAGIGIPKRAVTWVVSAGGGSAEPQTSMTDAEGRAWATWTLGPNPGPNRLEAVVSEVGLVTFNALAAAGGGGGGGGSTAPSPSRSTISVDPSIIEAGTGTATITVVVRDESGNPIEGANVVLRATGGGNSLTQPAATGPTGIATGTLSSTVPGTKVVSATAGRSVELSQTAQITVSAPVLRMELLEGNNQSVPAGTRVPTPPAVRITNDRGQPVAGVQVTFVVTGGGGAVSGASQTTNSDGIARVGGWTLGSSPGSNTLEARAESVPGSPVIFAAQGTAGGGVHHFVFRVQPTDVRVGESFTVEVAMVDAAGQIVPLSGIEIYLGLFRDHPDTPVVNGFLQGDRFRDTEGGVAVFSLAIQREGRYRFRALSDELPTLGPHGPEPYLFSNWFEVR